MKTWEEFDDQPHRLGYAQYSKRGREAYKQALKAGVEELMGRVGVTNELELGYQKALTKVLQLIETVKPKDE